MIDWLVPNHPILFDAVQPLGTNPYTIQLANLQGEGKAPYDNVEIGL